MLGQRVQGTRNPQRNAGSHQDVPHAGQHGAVQRRQVWNLNLLQIVHSHRVVVALARQGHLDEIGHDAQLAALNRTVAVMHGERLVRLVGRLSAGDEVLVPNALGHVPEGEGIEAAPHIAAGIAILQAPGEHQIERRSGNHSQLPQLGHGSRQLPMGHAHAHAALDNRGMSCHARYLF